MKKIFHFLGMTVMAVYFISCNADTSQDHPGSEATSPAFDKQWAKSFIDSSNAKISEQFRAGDSVALASYYWPDAELLLSNSEAVKGNEILAAWGAMTRMGIKDFTFSTTDITGDAEFLIETGNYEMKDEKNALVDRGKYVVVWQQRNGQWKLYRDIGNTSLPLPR